MKKDRKITLGLIGAGLITAVGLFGSVAGTLAWYAYSRDVLFSFTGTSVQKSVLLNIGLVDPDNRFTQAKCEEYGLVKETHDGKNIVFTHSSNGLSTLAIREYLTLYNHATDFLFPVTSRDRLLTDNGDLTLYKSPDFGDTILDRPTDGSEYVKLPFAFKIDEEGTVTQDKKVWLTDAVVTASGENINQAVRVFVETSQRKFLMKPADATLVRGETKVGGLLDLDGNVMYDCDELQGKELYYGDYTLDQGYSEIPYQAVPYAEDFDDADLDDVNGTNLNPLVESTFCAKHKKDMYLVDLDHITPKVAQYETFGTVKPLSTGPGNYYQGETGIPLCTTETSSGIGYCTMTIFIEGWDHAVVDKAVGHKFNLGLRFEISRLQ